MKANSRIEPRASLIIQRMRRALAVLLVLGAVVPAAAMEMQPSGTIESNAVEGTVLDTTATLEDYVSYALSNNPLLKAYMDNSSAAWQVPTQRRSLPDPVLSYGYFARNVETRVGPQEDSWILSQKFPCPGKLSLKGDIAAKDAEIADKLYEEKALDLIDQVKKTYYEYYQIYQDIRVLKQEKQVIRYMQDVAQIKYASGQVNQQDVLKAQLALSNLEDKLTMLERRLTTTITRFNRLLNREPLAPLAKPKADFLEAELGKVEQL